MSTIVAKATKPGPIRRARKPRKLEPLPDVQQPCQGATQDEIRLRAYHLWIAAGQPPGDGITFWHDAEQELLDGIVCANEQFGHRLPPT